MDFNDQQWSGFNDNYGYGGGGQNFNDYYFGGGGGQCFFGNFGGQNFYDYYFGGIGGQGGFNNCGGGGGFGFGFGFSNNISRSFNETNWSNWSNAANQFYPFESSGYQSSNSSSGGGRGGGPALSGWEARQRAFNKKRNQLQKINVNKGGAVRKPGPQPATKAVYNMRNYPNAAAVVASAAGRNTAGVQKKTLNLPGQKRVAPAPPLETEAASKAVKKWTRKRGFIMGGFRLPYLNDQLPQPESDSYARKFLEQIFNYSTNQVDDDEVLLNEMTNYDPSEDAKVARKRGRKIRKRIRNKWSLLYETKYKEWDNWWMDYKKFGEKIHKKLVKIGNFNLEHWFLPNLPKKSTQEVVSAIIKSAHFVLEENVNVPYDTMKTIFTLLNRTFLENLTELNILEVQDIIRNVPNDLWLYKLKSMVFLWSNYETIHDSKSTEQQVVKDQRSTAREWMAPVFHWLAKVAFDELVAISETEWKEHGTIFPATE